MIIYLFIICLIIVSFIYFNGSLQSTENFQSDEFKNSIQLNELKYGYFDQTDHNFLQSHQIKLFPLPLPLQEIKQPSTNLSQETIKEIQFLLEMASKVTDKQRTSIAKYEKDVLTEFIDYCKTNNLYYDNKYLEQVKDDIKALAYQLKSIYNRPRPYQLAFYMGKNLIPQQINASSYPSYPSYRTLLAKTLANVISYNNPTHSSDLHTIAKEVELSRLLGGYNYPSDTKVSLEIAAIIKKYIKYFEIKK